ncbi:MAG: helix-turn-helix transcriptional regulator [Gorillibacterium sp.]|nr:helix-turn-helix transcriptional regulator [Gorillibacterium sp.]
MGIVENIKRVCAQNGTTVPKLEKELGFGNGTIYNWVKSSPSIDKIQKVADHFNISVDRIIYGFDKERFTSIVNLVRYRRSIKEFSDDTGIDEHYLNRLCSGMVYEQPPIEFICKIADNNQNDWMADRKSIFEAAGYISKTIPEILSSNSPEKFEPETIAAHFEGEAYTEEEMQEILDYAKYIKSKRT